MRTEASTSSTRVLDAERAYFAEMRAVPRLDRDRETERARTLVRCRRAYWAILLSSRHLPRVLGVIVERAKDHAIVELAAALRTEIERGCPTAAIDRGVRALAEALDHTGDEHTTSDAIVALAARLDAGWHMDAVLARRVYLTARNRFVSANLRLVVAYAHRYGASLVPLADRIQEGNIGLMKAVDRFDPERGVRFSTYACWWIRHMILRSLSNDGRTVRIPSQTLGLHAKAERARRRLSNELGREPELDELAATIGCTPQQLEKVSLAMQLHNVRSDAGPDGAPNVFDTLGDDASLAALEHIVDDGDRVRALAALRELPAREQDIMHERYGFPGTSLGTLREIGVRHGMSRERVRQLHAGVLQLLRKKLEPSARLRPFR
jgi:RNA polymerase sigma factor (sigma-70 family)